LENLVNQDPGIALPSGGYFKFLEPETSDFTIEDIAHNLSHIARYNGAARYHYSVALHSVNVSRLVPEEFAFEALMHDAAEAFFGDMTSPLKRLCGDYCKLLEAGEAEVAKRFNLPFPHSPEVKHADMQALWAEKSHLIPTADNHPRAAWPEWDDYTLPREVLKYVVLVEMNPWEAKRRFLDRYSELAVVN
jgi:uncharacterized protein